LKARATVCLLCLVVALPLSPVLAAGTSTLGQAAVLGRVFLDLDADGRWSSGDAGLAGIRVLADAGEEALTDRDGRYHLVLLESGYDVLGGHVLKVDMSTLPAGTGVFPSSRRLVHLTPALVERVDFAVRQKKELAGPGTPPALKPAGRRAPALLVPGRGALTTNLSGMVPKGCRVNVDGEPVATDPSGMYQIQVTVHPGVNPHLVILQCDDGRLQMLVAEVHWVRRLAGGDLIVPARPRLLASCSGPPGSGVARSASVALTCEPEKNVNLRIGANQSLAGTQTFLLPVEPGPNEFPVEISYTGQGITRLHGSIDWQVGYVRLSGALLGNVSFSYGDGVSFIGSRLSGQMCADLPADMKLTLTGGMELADNKDYSVLDLIGPAWNPWIFERSPDPETSYPVLADQSLVSDSSPASGRYSLRLSRKGSFLGWGTFQTGAGGRSETGAFARSLVGAHASLRPFQDLFEGSEPVFDMILEGFFAQPQRARSETISSLGPPQAGEFASLPSHEEFLATGGSLYFLGHQWVVEGSARIEVVLRDARTGLSLERRTLRQGIDYQVDWIAGRLLLTQPVDHGFSGQAVRLVPTGANNTILTLDYEYLDLPDGGVDYNLAGGSSTLTVHPGGGVAITSAFTGVAQGFDSSTYRLYSGKARASFGRAGEIWAGYSRSRGLMTRPAYSVDGGLSFASAPQPAEGRGAGEAYEAGGRLSLSWLRARALWRRVLSGYADTSLLVGQDLSQGLLLLDASPLRSLGIQGRFSGTESMIGNERGHLYDGMLGASYRVLDDLVLSIQGAVDYGDGGFGDGHRALAGVRVSYRVARFLSFVAGHQQTLVADGLGPSSKDATLSTLGGELSAWGYRLGVEGGYGHEIGNLVSLFINNDGCDGHQVFANTTFAVDHGAVRAGGLTTGQTARAGQGLILSTSQTFGLDRDRAARGQRVGLEVPIGTAWHLHLAYERAELAQGAGGEFKRDSLYNPFFDRGLWNLTGPGRRNALFSRLSYIKSRLALSASGEYRVDEQLELAGAEDLGGADPTTHRQTVLTLAGRYNLAEGLALGGRAAWAETFGSANGSNGPGVPEGGMLEASLGLAYRPPDIDWLRFLLRAAAGRDDRPEVYASSAIPIQLVTWYTGSVAVMMRPIKYLQPTLVVAPWYKESKSTSQAPGRSTETGVLGLVRLGSEIAWGLGLSGEIRLGWVARDLQAMPPLGEGFEMGYGAEIFYLLEGPDIGALRLGVGYSFSDLPDPLLGLPDLGTGRRGVFVRLEGML